MSYVLHVISVVIEDSLVLKLLEMGGTLRYPLKFKCQINNKYIFS